MLCRQTMSNTGEKFGTIAIKVHWIPCRIDSLKDTVLDLMLMSEAPMTIHLLKQKVPNQTTSLQGLHSYEEMVERQQKKPKLDAKETQTCCLHHFFDPSILPPKVILSCLVWHLQWLFGLRTYKSTRCLWFVYTYIIYLYTYITYIQYAYIYTWIYHMYIYMCTCTRIFTYHAYIY